MRGSFCSLNFKFPSSKFEKAENMHFQKLTGFIRDHPLLIPGLKLGEMNEIEVNSLTTDTVAEPTGPPCITRITGISTSTSWSFKGISFPNGPDNTDRSQPINNSTNDHYYPTFLLEWIYPYNNIFLNVSENSGAIEKLFDIRLQLPAIRYQYAAFPVNFLFRIYVGALFSRRV